MHLTVSLDDLPRLIFIDNIDDHRLALTIGDIDNGKDLFQMLVGILTKGIVILYGRGTQTVQLDSLGSEEVAFMTRKFANVGIRLSIDMISIGSVPRKQNIVYDLIDAEYPNVLTSYRLRLSDASKDIVIGFELILAHAMSPPRM